ncbi:3-hydroxyacyl-CoA dehydrogenase family protein [Alkalibacillus aidingensis]|uniref:3-hydroxyacyl-CoA dehydrogenase family protein n=1 Tax=Alkalibacillus aidingensis TaxID=2747607 RepID=UPI001660BE8C|nr:3-hydroxyacyl-CoA dehydrogenase NAD-binding domain-containing protein [Alkalibacillus aidingensis]
MTIGVLGSGIMGNGIAQVFAMSGYNVTIVDLKESALINAKQAIEHSVVKMLEKKNYEESVESIINRISFTTNQEELKDAELVVEAIVENIEAKKSVFKELEEICGDSTILATNTSSLSVTEIAAVTNRPERVCGMHFFNPVPVMKLVEIIRGEETSEAVINRIKSLTDDINKDHILVSDAPLFVVNRILVPMISEAIFVLDEGIASAEDIDQGMMLGANHPIGPLKLADLIGLDTLLYVQQSLLNETDDPKYRIPRSLKRLVRAGHYGRKTGKGFYNYK